MLKIIRSSIPKNPGVYIYKNSRGEIIYVGKAKNLQNRVMSYFTSKHETSPKTQFLVRNISDYEFIVVDNEVEALLLENKLIKKHKPKYNINLKDSKTYAYIKITSDKIPKIISTRKITKDGDYFGPYIDGKLRVDLIALCISLFKIITPKTFTSKSKLYYELGIAPAESLDKIDISKYQIQVQKARDFLNGKNISKLKFKLKNEMDLAANNLKFELALERKNQLLAIENIQEKQKVDTLKRYDQDILIYLYDENEEQVLIQLMHVSRGVISGKKEFFIDFDENVFEDFIKMFYSTNIAPHEILINEIFWDEGNHILLEKYLTKQRGSKVELKKPLKGEKKSLVELAIKNAKLNYSQNNVLKEIKEKLNLRQLPKIIECFDMSNLGSEYLVGGMTRFVNQKEDKEGYRKFEIKSFLGKNDDFAAMREVVYRRYSRILENKKRKDMGLTVNKDYELPNLILIDGGIGQFNIAKDVLIELNLLDKIDLISIAKGEKRDRNEIYTLHSTNPLIFNDNSKMMLFLRKVRDSVHNFVISYNRKKRDMKFQKEISK